MFVPLFSAAMAYLPTMLHKYMAILVDLAGYITAPRKFCSYYWCNANTIYFSKKTMGKENY